MYSFEQSKQPELFLLSLGFGFLLGIFYDVVRAVRITFTKSKVFLIIFDISYFLISSILTYLFIIAVNKGEIRFYILFGEVIGFLFYYFSFGLVAIKITNCIADTVKKLLLLLKNILFFPFKIIFNLLIKLKEKTDVFFKKRKKNSRKNAKKLLPKLKIYVYNLIGMLFRQKNVKRGVTVGKKETQNRKEKT